MVEDKDRRAEPSDQSGADGQEIGRESNSSGAGDKGGVQYDTYRRVLGEAKKYKSLVEDLTEKYTELETRQLQAEGKKDEVIDSLKKQVDEYKRKLSDTVTTVVRSKSLDVVVDEALKQGCTSTKLLKKLVADEIDSLEVDEDFNPDRDQVRTLLDRIKKEEPVLFKVDGPKIPNPNLNPGANFDPKGIDLKKMSKDELLQLAKDLSS